MLTRPGNRNKSKSKKDPQKESLYRELVTQLQQSGHVVRREKLKRGFGWRVCSGSCRLEDQKIIFVDQRLSQDEQIAFLQDRIREISLVHNG